MIKNISISGLRGFGVSRTVEFAIPNGKEGSGLTILVGANNSGKTTILEALRSFNCNKDNPPSFSERKRNTKCDNGKVHLKLVDTENNVFEINTVQDGGSSTLMEKEGAGDSWWTSPECYILQSRRFVDYEFGFYQMERADYIKQFTANSVNRSASIQNFNARLFAMQKKKKEFDQVLQKVLGYDLKWTIELNENGNYYLKLGTNKYVHSPEGLGDGIWSIFTICDALYDSEPGSTIAIDEPELSLHPAYQKKVMKLFKEYSKDRQIIICTHSPYFIDMESLIHGAFLHRTRKNIEEDVEIYSLSKDSKDRIDSFLRDLNHPHVLGTEAKEIFFLNDRIILTEGQEDVVMYRKAAESLGVSLDGEFFGWGSGGATKIGVIARFLKDLGYKKIFAIFDGDKKKEAEKFKKEFPDYSCCCISQDDIRDKDENKSEAKNGMMKKNGILKPEYRDEMEKLLLTINEFMLNT